MRRFTFLILSLIISLNAGAFIEVRNSQFYNQGIPWRPIGVNLLPEQCDRSVLEDVANFGWNSIRIAPTSLQELKRYVKIAKREQLKICVVCTPDLSLDAISAFKKNEQIWAWEVVCIEQAKQVRIHCPHHLVTLAIDAQLTNLDQVLMNPEIDFLSVVLTPLELGWVTPTSLYLGLRNCYMKSGDLFQKIERRMSIAEKPILVSSCSYPRDKMFRLPHSSTSLRDSYFNFVMNYQSPTKRIKIGGVFFEKWESIPTEGNEDYCTPMSIFASDTLTQNVLF